MQRNLRGFAQEDPVLLASIPDYPDRSELEVSKEAWPLISAVIRSVTIARNAGAFRAFQMATRLP